MSSIVLAKSTENVPVPAGQYITIYTQDSAVATQTVGSTTTALATVNQTQQTFGPFASSTVVSITAGANSAAYSVDAVAIPAVRELIGNSIQRTPSIMANAGPITFASMASGLIISNSALGITCTLPTGAAIEAARDFKPDDAFDWVVMVTGLFGFTVGGSTGHVVVGNATVATGTSGQFRTRKTAPNTFITYRIA